MFSLFLRTLKSYSSREKLASFLALALFFVSLGLLLMMDKDPQAANSRKVYSEGLLGQIEHLNPLYTELNPVDADISSLIFSGLVRYDAENGTFEEDIATHTLSVDTLTYIFTLKNGLTWQDGVEVTAEDIVYTFKDVIQSPDFENPVLRANFEGVKIEALDSRSVSFELESANSFFFSGMTTGLLPKHILKDVPVADLDTHEFNQMPVGTGPYKVSAPYQVEGESMSVVLESWEDFYGATPQIQEIRFIAYPTVEALIENRSSWHGAAGLNYEQSLALQDQKRFKLFRYELPQYSALFFNTDAEAVSKNKTRTALYQAIDREALLSFIDVEVAIDSPLFELQEEILNSYDLEAAQTILSEEGYTSENPLEMRLVRRDFGLDNPVREVREQKLVEGIQSQWEALPVELIVEAYPLEDLGSVIQNRDYDVLLYGQSLGTNLDVFSYWHSSQVSEAGLNLSNYQNPRADLLMEKIRATFDPADKEVLLKELSAVIHSDVPAIFLYSPSYYYALDEKVEEVSYKKLLRPLDRLSKISSWVLN